MSLRKTINKLLQGSNYHINKTNSALNNSLKCHVKINIEHFLAKELVDKENFFFIQIGANDGVRADESYDFITKNNLKGIVVEPLSDMFEKLCQNYIEHPKF